MKIKNHLIVKHYSSANSIYRSLFSIRLLRNNVPENYGVVLEETRVPVLPRIDEYDYLRHTSPFPVKYEKTE